MRRLMTTCALCLTVLGQPAAFAASGDFGQEVPSATPGTPGKVFETGKDPTVDEYGVPSPQGAGTSGRPAGVGSAGARVASPVPGSAAGPARRSAGSARTLRVALPRPSGKAATLPAGVVPAEGGTSLLPLILLALGAAGLGLLVMRIRRRDAGRTG